MKQKNNQKNKKATRIDACMLKEKRKIIFARNLKPAITQPRIAETNKFRGEINNSPRNEFGLFAAYIRVKTKKLK